MKTVTVTGVDDGDTVGESVSISYSVASTDTDYDGFSLAAQPVTVTDNDTAGISSTGGASVAVTEGSDATYTLVLDSQPTAPVSDNPDQ